MLDYDIIQSALGYLVTYGWLMPVGLIVGIIAGAIPGFSSSNTLMMLLPVTLSMDVHAALIFMAAVYCGGNTGDSVPAILINVPGAGGSVATCFDGYAMAQKGKAQQALIMAVYSSGIGGLIGTLIALISLPIAGPFALQFKSPEMFVVVLFGIVLIAQIAGKSLLKGLLAGAFGLLLGATGFDHMWNIPRGTFGILELYDGIPSIAALVGLFAISECMRIVDQSTIVSERQTLGSGKEGLFDAFRMMRGWKLGLLRSSFIGTVVGVLPGAGASIASFLSYQQAMNFSKNPEKFGTGIPEGVMASEAANNAVTGGALIPMLVLGIPGSATTMVMLIVIQSHGLPVGPRLFEVAGPLGYTVVLGMLATYILMGIVGLPIVYRLAKVTVFPTQLLAPLIVSLTMVGAFAARMYYIDMLLAMLFGVIGYLMKRTGYPPHAAILGIILGPLAERYFLLSLRLSENNIGVFFSSPLLIVLWTILVFSLVGPWYYRRRYLRNDENVRRSA